MSEDTKIIATDLAAIASGEAYDPNQVYDLEIVGLDGQPLYNADESVMTIGLLGEDSDIAVKSRHKQGNRRIGAAQRSAGGVTSEGLDAESAEYFADLSVRWNVTLGGEKPAFTRAGVLAIYKNPRLMFIREQVAKAVQERSHFLRASAAT